MIRALAKIISFVFHPLFIVSYMLILLLLINPYLFGVNDISERSILIVQVVIATVFLPGFATFMLSRLGFVKSIMLKDRMDRIVPYIITGFWYLSIFVFWSKHPNVIPFAFSSVLLGATIALFAAFFLNNFSKISAHTVGVGGLLGMIIITKLLFSYDYFHVKIPLAGHVQIGMDTLLLVTVIIAGIVGTSRLVLGAHDNRDLYGGYVIGFLSQFVALRFLG